MYGASYFTNLKVDKVRGCIVNEQIATTYLLSFGGTDMPLFSFVDNCQECSNADIKLED